MRDFLRTSPHRLLAIALLSVSACIIVFPREQWNPAPHAIVLGVAAVCFAFLLLVPRIPTGDALPHWAQRGIHLGMAGLTFCGTAFAGRALSHTYGWDAGAVMRRAIMLHDTGRIADPWLNYFLHYPNNFGLLLMDRALIALAHRTGMSLGATVILFNAAALLAASLAVAAILQRTSSFRNAVLGQAALIVFLCTSSWNALPYTDVPTGAILAVSAALLPSVRSRFTRAAWVQLGIAAFLLAVAAQLKPTSWVFGIAVALCWALSFPALKRTKYLLQGGYFFGVAIAGAVFLTAVIPPLNGISSARLDQELAFPAVHFLRMGMEQGPADPAGVISYGGFYAPAVERMTALTTESERKTESTTRITSLLQQRGFLGYGRFLAHKATWIWQDATFGAWREGNDRTALQNHRDPISQEVQRWAHPSGDLFPVRNAILNGAWLSLLTAGGIFLWRARTSHGLLLVSLSTLGIGMFTLLFEGRARYLVMFLPLILVALIGPIATHSRIPSEDLPGQPNRTLSRALPWASGARLRNDPREARRQ